MKERLFDASDGVWRVAFAFDPKRKAILLVAGDKSGGSEKRFYKQLIAKADEIRRSPETREKGKEVAMAITLKDKMKGLSAERRKKVEAGAAQLIAEEMTLQELRRARKVTQVRLAKELGSNQNRVCPLEA